MDNITVHNYIVSVDPATAAFAYLIIGGWIGAITGVIYALVFGKKLIDKSFTGIKYRNPRMHIFAFLSGVVGATSTLFVLWGNQFGDPSVLTALTSGVLIYTGIYDIVTKQVKTEEITLPILATMIGSMLAAYNGSLQVTLVGIFLVLVLSNVMDSACEIFDKMALDNNVQNKRPELEHIDAVNLYLWRFLWLAVGGTILAFVTAAIRGKTDLLIETLEHGLMFIPFVITTMLFQFLGRGLKSFLKKDHALSAILIVTSAQIIFSYPLTFAGDIFFQKGIFGELPTSLGIWILRAIGAVLLIAGIIMITIVHRRATRTK